MLLEEDHMEDVVNLGSGRELQAVGNIAYALEHQLWPIVFRVRLNLQLSLF